MFIQMIDVYDSNIVLNINLISSVEKESACLYRINMNNHDTFLINGETYDDLVKCFKQV